MPRAYSSELRTVSLCQTNKYDLALPGLEEGDLRKSDILIEAVARPTMSVLSHYYAEVWRSIMAAGRRRAWSNTNTICTFTLYCLTHSPPQQASFGQTSRALRVAPARGLNEVVMPARAARLGEASAGRGKRPAAEEAPQSGATAFEIRDSEIRDCAWRPNLLSLIIPAMRGLFLNEF
jgi:hypothetical protein